MNFDDWKTEAPEDYDWRMGRRSRPVDEWVQTTGFCTCGVETTRSVSQKSGYRWICAKCGEAELRAIYDRASRKVS
jgi:hypothetical protein